MIVDDDDDEAGHNNCVLNTVLHILRHIYRVIITSSQASKRVLLIIYSSYGMCER